MLALFCDLAYNKSDNIQYSKFF